jgi:HK97 family phage major capsid protein
VTAVGVDETAFLAATSRHHTEFVTGMQGPLLHAAADTPQMLGKPLLESSSISSTFASKVLAHLDASQFYIVDRIGVRVVYDPLVLGATRRPIGQGAYYAFWRTGADAAATAAIRYLTLTT